MKPISEDAEQRFVNQKAQEISDWTDDSNISEATESTYSLGGGRSGQDRQGPGELHR